MKKREGAAAVPRVVWQGEVRTLTLGGEPALSYSLIWPQVTGAGWGGKRISRYYTRLAGAWRLRWQRELYWKACVDLAGKRAASRPFTPWACRMEGEVTFLGDGLLSLRMKGEEIRGDGKASRVQWGDTWKVREGAPCLPGELFGEKKGWKRRLLTQITAQGRTRQGTGDWFPDPDWEQKLRRALPEDGICLVEEGVEVAFPQCTIAPAAEGTPVFTVLWDVFGRKSGGGIPTAGSPGDTGEEERKTQ